MKNLVSLKLMSRNNGSSGALGWLVAFDLFTGARLNRPLQNAYSSFWLMVKLPRSRFVGSGNIVTVGISAFWMGALTNSSVAFNHIPLLL